MEATLEGQDVTVQIRSSKLEEKIITWPESLANDYLHQPIDKEFVQMCLYAMTRHYNKSCKAVKAIDVNDNKGCGYKVKGVKKYKFRQSHPGISSVI